MTKKNIFCYFIELISMEMLTPPPSYEAPISWENEWNDGKFRLRHTLIRWVLFRFNGIIFLTISRSAQP